MKRSRSLRSPRSGQPLIGLRLIATFKFVKAAAVIAAGLSALELLSREKAQRVHSWLQGLVLDQGHRLVASVAGRALVLLHVAAPSRLRQLAVGAFLYAGLFLAEGIGLARGRRWAEYLTVVVTLSFLPFELVALANRWTWPRAGTVMVNIVVVGYLVRRLRRTGVSPV